MVTVFLLILNHMEFHLVQNRKENCHHDHNPFNLKGNETLVFSVHWNARKLSLFPGVDAASTSAIHALNTPQFGTSIIEG